MSLSILFRCWPIASWYREMAMMSSRCLDCRDAIVPFPFSWNDTRFPLTIMLVDASSSSSDKEWFPSSEISVPLGLNLVRCSPSTISGVGLELPCDSPRPWIHRRLMEDDEIGRDHWKI